MAQYICPCCGQRFNGKKCRNCFYETFDDGVSQNLHVHKEVNVLDTPVSAPRSRPAQVQREWEQQKREYRRKQASRRQKKAPKGLIWLLVIFLLNPILSLAGLVVEEVVDAVSNFSSGTREPDRPDAVLPENVMEVFSGSGFTLYLGASEDQNRYLLFLENSTATDVMLSGQNIIMDGFLSEQSSAWCDAPAGTLQEGELYLDPEDIAWAVYGDPSRITVEFVIYDTESYENILVDSFLIDTGCVFQPVVPEGEVLLDTDDIFLSYLGYQPDAYDSQSVSQGTMAFYIENRSGEILSVYTEEALINGERADLSLWCQLPADTRTVTQMWLFELEDMDIGILSQMETLELRLAAYTQNEDLDLGWISLKP